MPCILIIDLGTTNIKTMIVNQDGTVLCEMSLATPIHYDGEIMEIDPEKLWDVVKMACTGLFHRCKRSDHVIAAAISSMAASFIPLDKNGRPLHKAIGWSDARSIPYMQKYMDAFLCGERIRECGQYPLPMYAPFKMQWFQDNYPELYKKVFKWVNVSEFIYYRLLGSGDFFTDYSIASRTMLFDDVKKTWNSNAMHYFSINDEWLAKPLPGGTIIGKAGKEAVSAGFSKDCAIILGGHDHMCACLGAGVVYPGTLLNSTGTSEALVTILRPPYEVETVISLWTNTESVVFSEDLAQVAYTTASGRIFQSAEESFNSYDDTRDMPPLREPVFIPPQRAQVLSIKGGYQGLKAIFDAQTMIRATRNGLYYECRRTAERMLSGALGDTVLRCVGGHTKNLAELQIKSNIMGIPIEVLNETEISLKGAFIIAASALGFFSDMKKTASEIYANMKKQHVYPVPEQTRLHDEIYRENYLSCFSDGIYSL